MSAFGTYRTFISMLGMSALRIPQVNVIRLVARATSGIRIDNIRDLHLADHLQGQDFSSVIVDKASGSNSRPTSRKSDLDS